MTDLSLPCNACVASRASLKSLPGDPRGLARGYSAGLS
jgi:hypothetical protein